MRIYQPGPVLCPSSFYLDLRASHHVAHVLRARPGDALTVFDGEGEEYEGSIVGIDKRGAKAKLTRRVPKALAPVLEVVLAIGVVAGEKMDFIIQKATELGATKIVPLLTDHGQVRLKAEREQKRLLRWRTISIHACEQSGRAILPEIMPVSLFQTWMPTVQGGLRFVLSPGNCAPIPPTNMAPQSVVMVVGPEGGLSTQETNLALEVGFVPMTLGPHVLRVETAVVAGLAICQWLYGGFFSSV